MDGRDGMGLPGAGAPGSYYMQRGMQGQGSGVPVSGGGGAMSELHGSPGFLRPMANLNVPSQGNIVGNSGAGSGSYTIETSSGMSLPQGSVGGSGMVQYGGATDGASIACGGEPTVKKKRGRPRKYGPDGTVSLGLSNSSSVAAVTSPSSSTQAVSRSGSPSKRSRGRPPGSGKKQQLASLGEWVSGSAGMSFTPHIIAIEVGEDIQAKLMAFSQQSVRTVCILSASGAVSTVTLNQPSVSGGSVTYEGLFEILCLSGSYMVTDNDGSRSRAASLTVSLSSPDGRVIGGGVGGMLIAASPVQVILGSFMCNGASKTKNKEGGAGPGSGPGSGPGPSDRSYNISTGNSTTSSSLNQNLAPRSTMINWPSSRQMDMRGSSHIDINLTRG